MTGAANKADFNQIPLKYKNVEAFKKAAQTTFNKGRMTLKSKKDLQEGERIILRVKFQTTDQTLQIISEIIQKKAAEEEGQPNTYGIRWINFTEKKLKKFLEKTGAAGGNGEKAESTATMEPPPPPGPPAGPPPPPEPPETAETPAPEETAPPEQEQERQEEAAAQVPPPATGPEPGETPEGPARAPENAPEAESPEEVKGPELPPETEEEAETATTPQPETTEAIPAPPPGPEEEESGPEETPPEQTESAPEGPEEEPSIESPPEAAPEEQPEETVDLSGEEAVPLGDEDEDAAMLGQEAPDQEETAVAPSEKTEGEAQEEPAAPLPPDQPAPSFEDAFASDSGGGGEFDLLSALDENSGERAAPAAAKQETSESPEEAPEEAAPSPEGPEETPPSEAEEADTEAEAGAESEEGAEVEEQTKAPAEEAPQEEAETQSEAEDPESPLLADLEAGAGENDFDLSGVLEEESAASQEEESSPEEKEAASSEENTEHAEEALPEAPAFEDETEEADFEGEATEEADEASSLDVGQQPIELGDESSEVDAGAFDPEEAEGPEETPEPVPEPRRAAPLAGVELTSLSNFLARFSRSVMDPESLEKEDSAVLDSLYEEFKSVMNNRNEIIIHLRSRGTTREFMVGGDVAEPVNLRKALSAEDFDNLSEALVRFFDAKGFTGLQLRRYLNDEAFTSLIRGLAAYDPETQTTEELGASLISEGVFHATPVHESERVVSDPSLDFRVDMTLSRLRGEINRLKYLAEAMQEDPDAVWTLRVEDALKPLSEGKLLADVLLRAEDVVSGQEEIDSSVLAQEMLLATPVDNLADAGRHLCLLYEDLYLKAGKTDDDNAEMEKIQKTLRQASARLVVEDPDAAAQIMGDLYRRGVFTLDELPPELRERMMVEQFVDSFLKDPQKRLEDFENIKKAKDYRAAARRYVLMIAELLRKQRVDEADRIFRTLLEHWKTPSSELPERQEIAGEALKLLSRPDCIKVLVKSLTDPGKQRREKVASILYAAGPDAAGPLIKQLAETEDRNARRLICEILTRLGPDVAEHIKARALDPHVPWYLLRNLVMVLGDMKSDALADELEHFLAHSHHRVREETLVYAAKAMGTSSEPYLVRALKDEDPLVHRRAVRLLSRFPQLSEEAVSGLAELMVKKPQEGPPPEAEQAVELAAKVLSRMGNVSLGGQKSLEDLIIESLEADIAKGFFGKLTGGRSKRTPKMRLALVDALAEVGTRKSRKLLTALAKDKDTAVKESAQKALAKIGA